MSAKQPNHVEQFGITSAFADIEKLCQRWREALGGQDLPAYEDVAVGNLGLAADDTGILRRTDENEFAIVRMGAGFEKQLRYPKKETLISQLEVNYRGAFQSGLGRAIVEKRPAQAVARCVVDGLVATCEILVLPLRSRWAAELFLIFIRQRPETHDLVDAIYRATSDGFLVLATVPQISGSLDFQIVSLNAGAARIFQRDENCLRWTLLSELVSEQTAGPLYRQLERGIAIGASHEFEYSHPTPSGDPMHLRVSMTHIGDLIGLTLTDISLIKLREESVRALFENNPIPLWVYEPRDLRLLRVNAAAIQHYGYSSDQLLAMTLLDLHPEDEHDEVKDAVSRPRVPGSHRQWRHLTADGQTRVVRVYTRELPFEGRICVLASIIDVTEQHRAEARIVHMAHHDDLTSLANRVLFRTRLDDGLAQIRRRGDSMAVHCIDLDRFKRVNDTLGHPVGDNILRAAAQRLKQAVRETDIVARLGGDEFAVLQLGVRNAEEASTLARRLIETLSAPYSVDDQQILIGASVGVALATVDSLDADVLLKNADIALYRSKCEGKGLHQFFEIGMDIRLEARRELEEDLRIAIAQRQFELFFQPIVDATTNRIVSCEALARWPHPQRGLVPPLEFISLAEETGLIAPLGNWILRQACAEAALWPSNVSVAVNVSPVQFQNEDLVSSVRSALSASGLLAQRLDIEITESVLLAASESNLATLNNLKALGVGISLDDFGTGYSSLSYLRAFPFSKIKLDRSFVSDLGRRPDGLAIVRSIAGLGRSLDIITVAEGVETEEQLQHLRAEGFLQVQGYLFSTPKAAPEIRKMLASAEPSSLVAA